jgi:hypothetical protein
MGRVLFRKRDELLVDRVHNPALDPNDHCLVATVADDDTLEDALGHYIGFLGHLAAPFAKDRVDPGNVAPHLPHARRVLELAVRPLEAQIENLLAEDVELGV